MAKSTKQLSEIDRLIELASDEKPSAQAVAEEPVSVTHALSLEDQKDPRPSMWRVLLQLRVLLPHLAKVLPLVERGLLGTNITGQAAPRLDTSHLDRGIAGIGDAQRDVNTAIKAQTGEIKAVQEQVIRLSKSLENRSFKQEELAELVLSLRKLVTILAAVMFVLLVVLIGLVGFALLGRRTG
jgi:hypothetical protein